MKVKTIEDTLRPIIKYLIKEKYEPTAIEYVIIQSIQDVITEENLKAKESSALGDIECVTDTIADEYYVDAPCDTEPSTVASNVVDISAWKS
tara:strand:- start:609 stop:884 length:276 start_codon:yes stop_codon:yes gene_type:complete